MTAGPNHSSSRLGPRLGPRPLPLHAFAAWGAYMAAITSSASYGSARLLLGDEAAKRIHADLKDDAMRHALTQATIKEASARWAAFNKGVSLYQSHPFNRPETTQPTIWTDGRAQLLDYAPDAPGYPVLAIPSLVNSYHALDLLPDSSLMNGLADEGFHPFLMDWGVPGEDAAEWTIDRYVLDVLKPALASVTKATGRPPILLGYCMGGLLATALAALNSQNTQALVLLAMPWDFHTPSKAQADGVAKLGPMFQMSAKATGAVPTDVLQTLFFSLDPTLALRKFRAFAEMDMASKAAHAFVAMEDWVNGGPDLAAPVAQSVLTEWYGENAPHLGQWRVAGHAITNASYTGPTLVAAPTRDRIVPPASSRAYAAGTRQAEILDVDGGHVGMIVGSRAKERLWRPLFKWLHNAAQ
jgi:polyhydroxyalkanoate synthase subunit PhaC